ncbi:maleylacetate reductase [Nocardioides immobilis]|uniref:Maleylacetate reductase n=1 Tax=Nocardioides immobilis TaxID=2049295 RepID=A0A417Y9I4_9ACTN|nr:maleylacetate reductase [Nocardioides immobilis]RHW29174.1 maleylacetate reductase [Nocardioides immobilis]
MIGALTRFVHKPSQSRVLFGAGSLTSLSEELARLDINRPLIISTPGQHDLAERVAALVGPPAPGVYPHARMHVPSQVAQAAVEYVRNHDVDGCVSVGGGSSVGLAKMVGLHTGLPIVAVPTTYAGSEMTSVWGLTTDGGKQTGRDERVLPRTVIYDLELSTSLTLELSVTSAVNALAHAVEAMYAPDTTPMVNLIAEASAGSLLEGVQGVAVDPEDPDARARLTYGAWLAGSCLEATTMSLHHKLCHILGGSFDLPHAWTHTVMLPYVMSFNLTPGSSAHTLLQAAFGVSDPAVGLLGRLERVGYRRSLSDLGLPREAIDYVIERAMAAPYANPHPVTADDLRVILEGAYDGGRLPSRSPAAPPEPTSE